eukprot:jgi/Mesvir1/27637/Mv07367-RA.1
MQTKCAAVTTITEHEHYFKTAKHCDAISKATNLAELLQGIDRKVEEGVLPKMAALGFKDLYQNYYLAVKSGGYPDADQRVFSALQRMADRVLFEFEHPFDFPSLHTGFAEDAPYNYFQMGQDYIGALVDWNNSYVGNADRVKEIEGHVKNGESVIFLANHQSEADPAAFTHMLEHVSPKIAKDVIYIAGDRVVADKFCKPFSMGRNLLCVNSKKHMDDIPELKQQKMRDNRRALNTLAKLLNEGGKIFWIAPSGGRDRPNTEGQWIPDKLDVSSAAMMMRLIEQANVPGRIYPFAMLTYPLMPPPPKLEKALGERRLFGFNGIGVSVGPEVDPKTLFEGMADDAAARNHKNEKFAAVVYEHICREYAVLTHAIMSGKGLAAATETTHLSQPWVKK